MWEKSHSYIVEERKKREEARQRSKEQEEARRKERAEWGRRVDEVLAERAQRSKRKEESQWKGIWKRYLRGWDELKEASQKANDHKEVDHTTTKNESKKSLKTLLPYPVLSLQRSDISREAIELFMRKAPQADNAGTAGGEVDLQVVLKAERVRWHPDKIQQRFGNMGADEGTMRAVTAVFQVVDRMWGYTKEKGG